MAFKATFIIAQLLISAVELQPTGSLHFASMCEKLDIEGNLIYVATGWGVEVYELRGEGPPVKIGEVPTPGWARDVAAEGGYVFVADGEGLTVIDASDPREMEVIATVPLGKRVWGIDAKNEVVYLLDGGLMAIDVSDPRNPKPISSLAEPKSVSEIVLAGDHMFLAAYDDGLWIFDISNPRRPAFISKVDLPMVRDVKPVGKDRAVVACQELVMLDLTDIKRPRIISRSGYGRRLLEVAVAPDGRFALICYDVGDGYRIATVDISDPRGMRTISYRSLRGGCSSTFASDMEFIGEGWAVVADWRFTPTFLRIDGEGRITEMIISPRSYTGLYPAGVAVKGKYAFIAHNTGLAVVDVSLPSNPKLLLDKDIPWHGERIYLFPSGKALVNGVFICRIDLSKPLSPGEPEVMHLKDRRLAVRDGLIFAADDEGLQIWELSDVLEGDRREIEPRHELSISGIIDMAFGGRYMFLSLRGRGVEAWDVWDVRRMKPKFVSYLEELGRPWRMATKGIYLIAGYKDEIRIFNVWNVEEPKLVSTLQLEGIEGISELRVAGNALLIAESEGLTIVDISSPSDPRIAARFDSPLPGSDVLLAGDTIYFVDYGDLFVFKAPFERIIDVSPKGNFITRYGSIKAGVGGRAVSVASRRPEAELLQNFPNPFNAETWIPFRLYRDGEVVISIFDINGRLVRRIYLGRLEAGEYITRGKAVKWDGRDMWGEPVGSGVYLYRLEFDGRPIGERRMIVLK